MMKPTSKSGVARPPPEGQAAVGRSDPGAGKGGRERGRAGVWTPAGGPRPFHSPSSGERGPAPTPHLNPPFGDTVSTPCPCGHGKGRQGLTDLGHCSLKQESLSCDLRHQHGTWHCYPGLGGECSRGLLLPCGRSLNSSRVFHYPQAILFPRGPDGAVGGGPHTAGHRRCPGLDAKAPLTETSGIPTHDSPAVCAPAALPAGPGRTRSAVSCSTQHTRYSVLTNDCADATGQAGPADMQFQEDVVSALREITASFLEIKMPPCLQVTYFTCP